MKYTINKGSHYSTPRNSVFPLNSHIVEKTWKFNESIIYNADSENDWNKLFGIWFVPPISWLFKNPTKTTRYNCAMVAFRWKNNQLELSPYLHRKGSKEYTEILDNKIIIVDLNTEIYTKIEVLKESVIFTISNNTFTYSFPIHSNIAFNIQPYFGGQNTSPNNITIELMNETN